MSQELLKFLIVAAATGIVARLIFRYVDPAAQNIIEKRIVKKRPKAKKKDIEKEKSRLSWIFSTITIFAQVMGILVAVNELFPGREWKLEGTVIDRDLHSPIAGVEVTVMKFSTLTDDNGNYAVQYDGKPRPEWRVKFTREGYGTLERTLTSDEYTEIFLETGHP